MNCQILDLEQGSEEWLNARKGKLTASVAKNIITPTGKLSTSAKGLMIDLATELVIDDPILKQRQDRLSNKDEIAWGNLHESAARECFADTTGFALDQVGFMQSRLYSCIGLSPDAIFQDGEKPCGLELKCPLSKTHAEWHYDNILPNDHKIQVHFSMAVTGYKTWYFMSYYPGLKPFIVKVERDDYTEKIEAAAIAFAEKYAIEAPKIWAAILPNVIGEARAGSATSQQDQPL